jgi:pyruvoyl-dependent arginine decarboxylase (PvlArgDC)
MSSTDYVAYGIYADRASFESALEALKAANFRNSDISAILPDRDTSTRDFAHEISSKAPEGAATGAGAGAAVGGILGWLIGVGVLAIPGVAPLVAAGPLVAALAGAGAAGATGGLVGAMIGAGVPEIEAKRYAGRIREGGYLISVHCDDKDWAKRAEEVLEATGGRKVVKTQEAAADYRP